MWGHVILWVGKYFSWITFLLIFEFLLSAEKVTQQLTELTKEAMPADIVSVSALRKAMGVALGPTEGGDQSEGEDIEELMETTPAEPTEENVRL